MLALGTTVLGLLCSVLAGALFQSLLALLAGMVVSAVLIVRSLRVSLVADRNGIQVRNIFRSYRVPWDDVTEIGIGITSVLRLQVSAVMLSRKRHGPVAAQATAIGEHECRRVLTALASMLKDRPIHFRPHT